MHASRKSHRAVSFPLLRSLRVLGCVLALAQVCTSQEPGTTAIEGLVTALHAPAGFDVNGAFVATSPDTKYGVLRANSGAAEDSLKDAIRVGAYVRATGTRSGDTLNARFVLVRDDADLKLEGFGLIDKVLSPEPEFVFQADGYRIRIAADTQLAYHGGLKSLADVKPDTWIKYAGKRDNAGVLVAADAEFFSGRLLRKSTRSAERQQAELREYASQLVSLGRGGLIDAGGHLVTRRKKLRLGDFGGACGWHRVAADQPLQLRVRTVGAALVPAFLRQLKPDDPEQIAFRFYVIDDSKAHSEIDCSEGLILIPRQAVERLQNDSQLAAILADGVAFNLQIRSARVLAKYNELLSAERAGYLEATFIPGLDIATETVPAVARPETEWQMQQQRARVALTLMADAGYDPWQAPEAWRLLAPPTPGGDPKSPRYPARGSYQLSVLYPQYCQRAAAPAAKPPASGDIPTPVGDPPNR